jgi:quercetin dioxygenase-like cupin family protein
MQGPCSAAPLAAAEIKMPTRSEWSGNRYSIEASQRGLMNLRIAKLLSRICACAILLQLTGMASRPQDEVAVDPSIAKVEFENDQVRVLRVSYAPHQKSQMHSHPSRFNVPITSNDVRAFLPDGSSRANKRGAHEFFWSEPVTHQVENLSDQPTLSIEIELKQAKGPGVEVKPAASHPTAQGTESDPVPVEQEPHHHVIFENPYVRVLDVIVKPGETTLFHRHSLDNVAVLLSDATMRNQAAGKDWADSPAKEGTVHFAAGTQKPYTHRITNKGSTVFHVLDVQILP